MSDQPFPFTSGDNVQQPAPTPAPLPLKVTVEPSHPSHWLDVLRIIQAVHAAEQPLLLQILPQKGKIADIGASVGVEALIAAIEARLKP